MLGPSQLDELTERGYVCVRSAIPKALARECRLPAAEQLDIDMTDAGSWTNRSYAD